MFFVPTFLSTCRFHVVIEAAVKNEKKLRKLLQIHLVPQENGQIGLNVASHVAEERVLELENT